MTARKRWGAAGVVLLLATTAVAALGTTVGGGATKVQSPIIIGWAYDSKGNMAPFDNPALAAARIQIRQINAKGGVLGRKLQINVCDTNNNNPAKAKACARSLIATGAHVIFTTCDVDFATPVVQEAINRGKLAIAPCIGTDQMGPKRFGAKASSHSASATSPRTRARRWLSSPGARAGGRPGSARTQ
ncbi:MAG: ABC transporter substrate-binding protein [Actinobacteria bacterium]|nr:ABC transporter substrate-binding protein [Actinomycetota bacterium]